MERNYAEEINIVDDVVRWKSNERIPFDDVLVQLIDRGVISWATAYKTVAIREIETEKSIQEYRKARMQRTPEELAEERFEMRAAFGPGETVVNVFTGEVTRL